MPSAVKNIGYSIPVICGVIVLLALLINTQQRLDSLTSDSSLSGNRQHLIVENREALKSLGVAEGISLRSINIDNVFETLLDSRSLSGTVINDQLEISPDGNLVISKSVIDLFDYFLIATGEVADEEVIQGIRSYLFTRLEEPALSTALELLDNYMAYIEALEVEFEQANTASDSYGENYDRIYNPANPSPQLLANLKTNLNYLSDMRTTFMGDAAAAALWGEDELYDRYTLSRLEMSVDTEYDSHERLSATNSLEMQLPEHLRVERLLPYYHLDVSVDPNDEHSAYLQNSDRYGEQAAIRLQHLHSRRQAFNLQYESYNAHRQKIIDSGLSAENQEDAIKQLQIEYFEPEQLSQVRALDRIQ